MLSAPDARAVDLETGDGRLVVGEDGSAVLVLSSMEPAPNGKTYEVWVANDGCRCGPGSSTAPASATWCPVEQTVAGGSIVMVTVEDDGGVDAPTSDPIVVSQPA